MDNTISVTKGSQIVKTIYFYLVSFVALLMIVIPTASIINLGVRQFVFRIGAYENYYPARPVAVDEKMPQVNPEEEKRRFEEQQKNQLKRDIARDVSFLLIGIPLFIFNWRLIKRNKFSE